MNSTERLMQRFTLKTESKDFAKTRVNRAGRQINEQEENGQENIKPVKGVGNSDHTTGKDNGFAEHTEHYVKFAVYGQEGIPMIVVMPKLDIHTAIVWIQQRLKGFEKYPKSRESQNDAIRRKGIAAMGQSFVSSVKSAGKGHVPMEVDMMFSKDSHSQIGNIEKTLRRRGVVNIQLNLDGTVIGLYDRVMVDNDGLKMVSPEMVR